MDLNPEHRRVAVLVIIKNACRLFGSDTRRILAEVSVYQGRAYRDCDYYCEEARKILNGMDSFKHVKSTFNLTVLHGPIEPLVLTLQTTRKKWEEVEELLQQVPKPNFFLRLFESNYAMPIEIPGEKNGFKTETPNLLPLLQELVQLYETTENSADEMLNEFL